MAVVYGWTEVFMMNVFEKGGAIVGVITTIGGGFFMADNHFAKSEELVEISEKATAYYKMNAAQIQLHIVEKDLQYLVSKPDDKKDQWDKFKENQLRKDYEYWSDAVKKADAKVKD